MRPVIWSDEASGDYLNVLRHVAANDVVAAERICDAIEATGNKLGALATGRPGRVAGTYEKSVSRLPYVIAHELRYVAGRESVVVLRVIHTSRDWPASEWPQP